MNKKIHENGNIDVTHQSIQIESKLAPDKILQRFDRICALIVNRNNFVSAGKEKRIVGMKLPEHHLASGMIPFTAKVAKMRIKFFPQKSGEFSQIDEIVLKVHLLKQNFSASDNEQISLLRNFLL